MPRFVIQLAQSVLTVRGSSSLHPYAAAAPITGHIDAEVTAGELMLDPPPSGRVQIEVNELHGPDRRYDREFRNRLDFRRYPHIVGVLRELARVDKTNYRMTGDLTVRGVTRPVDGTVRAQVDGDGTLRGVGKTTVDVRQFGIDPPRLLFVRVDALVAVQLEFVAVPED